MNQKKMLQRIQKLGKKSNIDKKKMDQPSILQKMNCSLKNKADIDCEEDEKTRDAKKYII